MRRKAQTQAPAEGFLYRADTLLPDEEQALVERIRDLPLKEFEFHGYVGKRRTFSYGWHYDFGEACLQPTEETPAYLHRVRERAAAFAGLKPGELPHALVTEYGPGAAIGWHRDKGVFGGVVGISLLSPCNFRLRRKSGTARERYSLTVEPRSVYLLRGSTRASASQGGASWMRN